MNFIVANISPMTNVEVIEGNIYSVFSIYVRTGYLFRHRIWIYLSSGVRQHAPPLTIFQKIKIWCWKRYSTIRYIVTYCHNVLDILYMLVRPIITENLIMKIALISYFLYAQICAGDLFQIWSVSNGIHFLRPLFKILFNALSLIRNIIRNLLFSRLDSYIRFLEYPFGRLWVCKKYDHWTLRFGYCSK